MFLCIDYYLISHSLTHTSQLWTFSHQSSSCVKVALCEKVLSVTFIVLALLLSFRRTLSGKIRSFVNTTAGFNPQRCDLQLCQFSDCNLQCLQVRSQRGIMSFAQDLSTCTSAGDTAGDSELRLRQRSPLLHCKPPTSDTKRSVCCGLNVQEVTALILIRAQAHTDVKASFTWS